ncbi:MAG: twin-arginine translocation pathway signal [Mycobacterium sp.]|nr:twin-arginine translocation pathway signal [Mycobacterium sp.]
MSTNDQPETTADEALPIEVLDDEAVEVEVFDDEAVKVEALHDPEQGVPPVASGRRWRLSVVLPLALLALSAAAAASVYWFLFRPDQMTDADAQQQVIAAAKEGTEAVLSYSPENLDQSLATAKSHLTGGFLDEYSTFTDEVVRPAVTQRGVKTEANVARAAVSQMDPGRAQVLIFVNQVTTSKERPSPALATSSVMVTMVENGGRWLISEFKPI